MYLVARKNLQMQIAWPVSGGSCVGVLACLLVDCRRLIIIAHCTAQCPSEDCTGDRAYFFQLQIRSADEPMTTFLKVCILDSFHPSLLRRLESC